MNRPPSNRPGARCAFDYLTKVHAPLLIVRLWFAREMDDGVWCAQMSDGRFKEIDVLVINYYRNNPGKRTF